jgi:hypothetical protein
VFISEIVSVRGNMWGKTAVFTLQYQKKMVKDQGEEWLGLETGHSKGSITGGLKKRLDMLTELCVDWV